MNYKEARAKVRSGDVLAWRGRGIISWVIRHITGGSHTHVGVAWFYQGRLFVLEAREGRGVQIRAVSQCGNFDWLETGLEWSEKIEKYALLKLGLKYGYVDTFWAGLGKNFGFNSKGLICSEFVGNILRHDIRFKKLSAIPSPTVVVQALLDAGAPLRSVNFEK